MLLKIDYLLMRWTFGLAVLMFRGDQVKNAELLVLRHENAVLRRNARRVRYEPADRAWFTALTRFIPRRRWTGVFAVTPTTLLAWHRRLAAGRYDTSNRRQPGRPATVRSIARLAVRLAKENPLWGYRRIHGELTKLGVTVAPSTVYEILRSSGIAGSYFRAAHVRSRTPRRAGRKPVPDEFWSENRTFAGQAAASGGAKRRRLCRCGGLARGGREGAGVGDRGFDGDFVAEALEAPDVAAGLAVGVHALFVVVRAKVGVGGLGV